MTAPNVHRDKLDVIRISPRTGMTGGNALQAGQMADLQYDPTNANKGTVRGRGMLERSLQQYGAGRAPVASADGVILAGNKTIEVARELGIPVQEIESDGTTLYVIRRTDLPYDDPRAKELAIADNRSGEVSLEWDADVLASFVEDGIDLDQFWFPEELDELLNNVPDFEPVGIEEQGRLDEKQMHTCPECGHVF